MVYTDSDLSYMCYLTLLVFIQDTVFCSTEEHLHFKKWRPWAINRKSEIISFMSDSGFHSDLEVWPYFINVSFSAIPCS